MMSQLFRRGDEAEGVAERLGGGGGVVEVLPALGEVEWRNAVGKVPQEVAVGVIHGVACYGDYEGECEVGYFNYAEAFGEVFVGTVLDKGGEPGLFKPESGREHEGYAGQRGKR